MEDNGNGMPFVEQQYEAYWPRSPRQTQLKPLAKRLDTLDGKTIAQLWDCTFRGDEIYLILEEELKKRYRDLRFISWREFGNIHGAEEREIVADLPRRFKEMGVDAVLTSMGC